MPSHPAPPIRSVATLLAALEQAPDLKYLFFWGHTAPAQGGVDKSCFSQWFPAPFTENGLTYPTTEHYMMAEKARLMGDETTRAAILRAPHPKEAKRLGRQITPFDEARWLAARLAVVVRGNTLKFAQNPPMATFLHQTGTRVLVEASPVDSIWGNGLAQDNPRAMHPAEWPGLNLLGFALMEVRDRLASV